jgi:photoactive yellow protein
MAAPLIDLQGPDAAQPDEVLRRFDPLRADEATDEELDRLQYGVILLDESGGILRYNLAEARLARLDRAQVLGKKFYGKIAPCTATPEFQGRVEKFLRDPAAPPSGRFDYIFDFRFGAQQVDVEMVRAARPGHVYLLINRRKFGGLRKDARAPAIRQEELAPGELELGVIRDANQRREVHLPPHFFAALRHTWDRVAPQGQALFSQEWGTKWGRLAVVDLEVESLEATGRSLREVPMREAVQRLEGLLRRQGWGQLGADFTFARRGAFAVSIARGALGESLGASDLPRCHLLEGFFRAFFTHLAERLLLVREVACATQGAPLDCFVVTGPSRKQDLERAISSSNGDVALVLRKLSEGPLDPAEQAPSEFLAQL